ncbi:MAG TPA: HEAT repeat domain-containing protein [Bryobacteraceae bacterium]|nr:HEAT repeat domain-containing protein [Bryobacteraceae bacterium]
MICDRMREQIPECLAGRLDAATREKLIDHLDTCSACRADMAELGVVWRGIDSMSEPEPSPAMRARFLETLNAYQEGYQEAQRRQAYNIPQRSFWAGLWPSRPAWQVAFSAALLLAGVLGGRYFADARATRNPEMAQLQAQVENLRQLVTLSLLQEQSPSSRLRGVTYSYQMTQPDPQVEQELLHTVNHDSNVNVRLSAVEAIGAKFGRNVQVQRALVDAIAVQESPLVQLALIDLLVQLNDKDALPALRRLVQDKDTDDEVRQRAGLAVQRLESTR